MGEGVAGVSNAGGDVSVSTGRGVSAVGVSGVQLAIPNKIRRLTILVKKIRVNLRVIGIILP